MLGYFKYLAICTALTCLIMAILALLRKRYPHNLDEGRQQVVGSVVTFIATVYAFILGFSIVTLWQMHDTAQSTVSKEVNELRTMYRLSKESPYSGKLSETIIEYIQCVRDEEWNNMAKGTISKKADRLKELIWKYTIATIKLQKSEGVVAGALLDSFDQFNTSRRLRVSMVDGKLHPLLIISLITGGIFTLISFYFLSIKNSLTQLVLEAALVGTILVNLSLVYALNKPFSGSQAAVSSIAFTRGLEAIYLLEEQEKDLNK